MWMHAGAHGYHCSITNPVEVRPTVRLGTAACVAPRRDRDQTVIQREGPLARLTIFAKANLDVRDSLHSYKIGGKVLWNGINELVRERFAGAVVRLRHEILARSDALLEARGEVPAELLSRKLSLDPYTASAQFSQALFEADCDVFVLSIQPDVMTRLVRHRRDGYLLYPANCDAWPAADRQWLRDEFTYMPPIDVDRSMGNFETIIARLRARSAAPILVYNVSAVVPGESIHCHEGLDEILSTRMRKFNVALAELSQRTGISVIDVDTIVARAGADRLKVDAVHLTAEGSRLIAEEVVRVLDDLGCISPAAPH
jgi:hypothetical protein